MNHRSRIERSRVQAFNSSGDVMRRLAGEPTKPPLPVGAYWDAKLGRYILPDDPQWSKSEWDRVAMHS